MGTQFLHQYLKSSGRCSLSDDRPYPWPFYFSGVYTYGGGGGGGADLLNVKIFTPTRLQVKNIIYPKKVHLVKF